MPRMVQMECSECKEVFTVASVAKNCKKCVKKGVKGTLGEINPESADELGDGPILLANQSDPVLNGAYTRSAGEPEPKDTIDGVEVVAGEFHGVQFQAMHEEQYGNPHLDAQQKVSVEVPVDHVTIGNAGLAVVASFRAGTVHQRPRAFLRGALSALIKSGARLSTGKKVSNTGHVVVWILEQLADNCDLPLKL